MILAKGIRFFKTGIILFQTIAIGIAVWEAFKKSSDKNSIQHTKPDMKKKFSNGRDVVDESSWESFPSSDPPAANRFT